jgi:Rrf2 family transcriptional regulator, cysteine metabolism repressor
LKMSTKGRYGLRVMIELAIHYGKGPVSVEVVAKNQKISGKYIHVLVSGLKLAGLIHAERGPSGGYELAKKPSSITALDVILALEGKYAPVKCVCDSSFCPQIAQCSARDVWCEVASAVEKVLSAFTLEQLAARQHGIEGPLNYCI